MLLSSDASSQVLAKPDSPSDSLNYSQNYFSHVFSVGVCVFRVCVCVFVLCVNRTRVVGLGMRA